MKYFARLLREFVSIGGNYYVPPESSGRDGYVLNHLTERTFVSNKMINEAEKEACKIKTSFMRNGLLFALPYEYAEDIKYERFLEVINLKIKHTENEKEINNYQTKKKGGSRQTKQG